MPNARLAEAPSPYLRQHADDPVQWYTWGQEAFEAARERDVPIFLSIGYSACHWCHVMQRESFKDEGIAATLNERFVPVKVDRELRPDVDTLYMDYVVATTGHGGWPMSVFLSPDLAPLLGGTYFPPRPMSGVPSFEEVLTAIDQAYRDGGDEMRKVISSSLTFLREQAAPHHAEALDRGALDASAEYLLRLTDQQYGGFGKSAKFPQAPLLLFLAAYHDLNPDAEVRHTLQLTITSMIRGGVYDQAGGGMFRYAVDREWRTPHFEKMLYDQALLLSVLASASKVFAGHDLRDEFAHAARRTAAFLDREMRAEGGCFVASLAAETLGEEGGTYVWTREQLAHSLAGPAFQLAKDALGADEPDEPFTLVRREGRADRPEIVDAVLGEILAERDRRPQPMPDTKVVTSWNALAARGLMEAGEAFGDADMSRRGVAALVSLLETAMTEDGPVHVAGDPSVADVRLIEDAAHIVAACLTAHEVTGDRAWLERAERLHAEVVRDFTRDGVLYMTAAVTDLPVRPREQSDQPTPSGAATSAENGVRLAAATGDAAYASWARDTLRQFWGTADAAPEHAGTALSAAVALEMLGAGVG